MSKFFVWFKSEAGCDYSVGCGELLVEVKNAKTLEEARKQIPKIICDYNDEEGLACDHYDISDAIFLEFKENVYHLIEEKREQIKEMRAKRDKANKRAELERLKRELGET